MGQSNDDPTRHRRFSISCRSPIIAQLPQPAITGHSEAAGTGKDDPDLTLRNERSSVGGKFGG